MITVDLRQLVLVLDDDDDHRGGHARRDGLHLDATGVQHSAGKSATARARSCRRRPCPRRVQPSRTHFPHTAGVNGPGPWTPGVGKGIELLAPLAFPHNSVGGNIF